MNTHMWMMKIIREQPIDIVVELADLKLEIIIDKIKCIDKFN